jgi:deazaflavin-dependent oxidoreductase (nitroreductase family)
MNDMITPTSTTYRPSFPQRIANAVLSRLVKRGKGPDFMRLLTVNGRTTGRPYTAPVVPVVSEGEVWLVSPFGDVSWVRNLRVVGRAQLARGAQRVEYHARELTVPDAVPVIRAYLSMPSERFVRKDFRVTAGSTDDEIAREAPEHPVFALTPAP